MKRGSFFGCRVNDWFFPGEAKLFEMKLYYFLVFCVTWYSR